MTRIETDEQVILNSCLYVLIRVIFILKGFEWYHGYYACYSGLILSIQQFYNQYIIKK